jgi:hypothetical protein
MNQKWMVYLLKYKIQMKKGKIKGTALVAGDNKNILAYLQSDDYDMDDENIADIYPEVVAEAYDRDKLVNKMMKPIKDKEAFKGKDKDAKKEASGGKEEYQKFFAAALKKFGVKSPAELKGDKEKEFYNYIDKNWDAKSETDEDLEEGLGLKDLPPAFIHKNRDAETGREVYNVMSDGFKSLGKFKNIKDAENFLDKYLKKFESVEEARKEPWIPFAKSDAFITKDRDAETGRGEFYNVRSGEGFKIIKTFKTMNDAEKFLDKINKESVEEARKEPWIPFAKSDAFITKDRDAETGRGEFYNVRSGEGFKIIKTFKTMKDAEKFLDKINKMDESVNEDVGANGHAGGVQDINQGLSPKALFVKAFQEPETPDYVDANKTALSTFANIMNSVNVAMDYRASDNKVQDPAPENTIQKLANSTK